MKKFIGLILVLTMVVSLGMIGASCTATNLTPGSSTTPTNTGPANADTGTLQVLVTDAPPIANVTSILLTVSKIEVHKVVPGEETATPTTTATPESEENIEVDNTSWTNVAITGPMTFDLLQIKGIEQSFAAQALEAGKYTQIRLTVDKAEVGLDGGTPQEATLPSGVLKFVHPFEVKSGETTAVLMDFDAAASVNITGNDNIIVKPIVKLSTKPSKTSDD